MQNTKLAFFTLAALVMGACEPPADIGTSSSSLTEPDAGSEKPKLPERECDKTTRDWHPFPGLKECVSTKCCDKGTQNNCRYERGDDITIPCRAFCADLRC